MKTHALSEIGSVPEALVSMFRERWLTSVEDAVAYLSSSREDVEGRESFLAAARALIGDERYTELSAQVPERTLGCVFERVAEDRGTKGGNDEPFGR